MERSLAELDDPRRASVASVKLTPILSAEAFAKFVPYPVIVESWDKRKFGQGKKRWLAEFTEEEREIIARNQRTFRRWYLETGPPDRIAMELPTFELLKRAVHLFATI